MSDAEDYVFFSGKKPSRTYVSRRVSGKRPDGTNYGVRGVSKVFDIPEFKEYIRDKKHIILQTTPNERQEVKAWVDEDTRGYSLSIQRFETSSGVPHKYTAISFRKGDLQRLKEFLESLGHLDFSNPSAKRIDDQDVAQIRAMVRQYADDPEIATLLASVSKSDIAAVAYRRDQLGVFEALLANRAFFDAKKKEWGKQRDEDVWQHFFQANQWVFGYGLNYVFNEAVNTAKIEQSVRGHDAGGAGKRVDALLKTAGFISSIVLVEIKTHATPLLKPLQDAYRKEAWQLSDELNGGVAQSHRNVEETVRNARMSPVLELKTEDGAPTGTAIHSYQPKSYLIVGCLEEFITEHGVNKEKFSSFELFRRSLTNPEIITFDELYERARHIVQHGEDQVAKMASDEPAIEAPPTRTEIDF